MCVLRRRRRHHRHRHCFVIVDTAYICLLFLLLLFCINIFFFFFFVWAAVVRCLGFSALILVVGWLDVAWLQLPLSLSDVVYSLSTFLVVVVMVWCWWDTVYGGGMVVVRTSHTPTATRSLRTSHSIFYLISITIYSPITLSPSVCRHRVCSQFYSRQR